MERKKVFVGLSGGVDSSVAALRLLRRGYDVEGVFIKVWQPDFIRCDWEKERLDAMRVAAHLEIPFLTCDAEDAYKKHVADYMIDAYKRGLTPNPDVMCNEFVKFGAFFEWARTRGADYVATGHYAQIVEHDGTHILTTAKDSAKDQTYFLARMSQDALNHTLFPIGDTRKDDIRKEAERAGLPTFKKADSQGICFLGQIDIPEFLSHYMELHEGIVLDRNGHAIGTHRGALLYTKGQRHGFTVTTHGGQMKPYYVIARDIERNELTADTTPPTITQTETIMLTDVRELGNGIPSMVDAVFRYHGTRTPVWVHREANGGAILTPKAPSPDSPTRGQVCVFYVGRECVGSGIIA